MCESAWGERTHVALYLGEDGGAAAVDDGVDLLDDVEVGLVVGVLDAGAPPGDVRQLPARQLLGHAAVVFVASCSERHKELKRTCCGR